MNELALESPALIERFESYFRDSDSSHHALREGDRSIACENIKSALIKLGCARVFGKDVELFDEELSSAVRRFQAEVTHNHVDGVVGQGTRAKLVVHLLRARGASAFGELKRTGMATVFISYAWADAPRVDKVNQWLRDRNVRVIRDVEDFKPGSNIKTNILDSVLSADKVIAVYSANSRVRDWPSFERQITEEVERLLGVPVLVYLCLDESPLMAHDPHRLAIKGQGKPLRQIGAEVLKALDMPVESPRYEYNEDDPI